MDKPETGKVWVESLLTQHLGRVAAPPELWGRIQSPGTVVPNVQIVKCWCGRSAPPLP